VNASLFLFCLVSSWLTRSALFFVFPEQCGGCGFHEGGYEDGKETEEVCFLSLFLSSRPFSSNASLILSFLPPLLLQSCSRSTPTTKDRIDTLISLHSISPPLLRRGRRRRRFLSFSFSFVELFSLYDAVSLSLFFLDSFSFLGTLGALSHPLCFTILPLHQDFLRVSVHHGSALSFTPSLLFPFAMLSVPPYTSPGLSSVCFTRFYGFGIRRSSSTSSSFMGFPFVENRRVR